MPVGLDAGKNIPDTPSPWLKAGYEDGRGKLTSCCCNASMDSKNEPAPQASEDLEVRKTRVRQVIDSGGKESLSEEDFLFAVKNALILDGQTEA